MNGQTDMARRFDKWSWSRAGSDPDQELYTLKGQKEAILPVTFFLTTLIHPFNLRVTVEMEIWKQKSDYLQYWEPISGAT